MTFVDVLSMVEMKCSENEAVLFHMSYNKNGMG
jgi:hypothetical protein